MHQYGVIGKQTLLLVPGCSVPSAASVVVGFARIAKPVVGLALSAGRSLRVAVRVEWGSEVCLVLLLAFDSYFE